MPDGMNSGLQGVMNEITSTAPTVPPPGSGLIPGANAAAPPPQPPDYEALGKKQASADFAAASGNAGWEFDPAAIDDVITTLEDSLDGDHQVAKEKAKILMQIVPPGAEVGSQGYADVANKSGVAYNSFLTGAINYIQAYVDTLKQIRTAYQNNDQNAKDQLRAAGKVD
ncbi:PE domain-containing protein [Amycolatopsis orientalis]|uniref:PE domain-containing protein n=1 Tax=Amycolatopsis orientalis TaxID=31958 RepID=UPI0003A2ECED|nr:PE domain-containing protein [Amycolatopsis orientalis]